MAETNSPNPPQPDECDDNGFARAKRRNWLLARAADTLRLADKRRLYFLRAVKPRFVFQPQAAAAGTVLAPLQARRLLKRRMICEPWRILFVLGFILFGAVTIARFDDRFSWASAATLVLLGGGYVTIESVVRVPWWSTEIPAIYATLPPPGAVITADTAALTVNGIAVPWPEIALKEIRLRLHMPLWSGGWWTTQEYIDRLTLRARAEILMLDRSVVTDGQVLLDTICDKLDMTAGAQGAAAGDVNPQDLTLYAGHEGGGGNAAGRPKGAVMTTFDKREEGFEKKFAHDEELKFKAMARRNKLLGLWAAGLLGKSGPDAEAYAKEVVLADFEEAGDNDVVRKVLKDLEGKGVSEQDIRAKMAELLAQAVEQIQAGK
jgi:hypothetical protein